jgi:hypothetical protein
LIMPEAKAQRYESRSKNCGNSPKATLIADPLDR